jgi:LAO/AO transport system kinase
MKKTANRELIKKFEQGDRLSLARLLTLAEKNSPQDRALLGRLFKKARGVKKLGITGPPGAGKSTLINCLVSLFRKQDKTVACVLVDPSSPISGGAVLGDRIRMQEHFLDPGVFLRSVASRGEPGGLCRSAIEMALLLDAFGMDEIIIETVGVGQSEIEVAGIAETVLVVLTPEAGDAVQVLKAGLLEVGEIFVVNKSDRPGAQALYYELAAMFEDCYSGQAKKKVLMVSAAERTGLEELAAAIVEHRKALEHTGSDGRRELRKKHFIELLVSRLREGVEQKLVQEHPALLEQVVSARLSPAQALEQLEGFLPGLLKPGIRK